MRFCFLILQSCGCRVRDFKGKAGLAIVFLERPMMTLNSAAGAPTCAHRAIVRGESQRALFRILAAIFVHAGEWRTRLRQRTELLMLADNELQDMRLTLADADAEAKKPFWKT
jgi:uncharacterized protein YjiS (DUF1127 family)